MSNSPNPTWLVYCHTNLINNKKYIGITKHTNNPNIRWRDGVAYCGKGTHHKIFKAAIEKYGWENFSHEVLEDHISTLEAANKAEQYWIAYYHTYIGDPLCAGYNATRGGDGTSGRKMSEAEKEYRRQLRLGTKATEATKQKMSATRKGKPQNMTEKKIAQLQSMHDKWRGCRQSDEAVEKIRAASIGRLHSDITKQKISETKRQHPNHTKRIGSGRKKQIQCIETGEIFESITAAALHYSISKSSIMSCAKQNRHSAGGLHWRYILLDD